MNDAVHPEWITPDWPAPAAVRAFVTTRAGGVSAGAFASMNLGLRSGDAPDAVRANRAILRRALPAEPVWLDQVHGTGVIAAHAAGGGVLAADAAWTGATDVVCAVLVADCMPVFLCDRDGTAVAVAHAGWRGMAGGVIEATVRAMPAAPERLLAWLGPAIGPRNFEVGDDVRSAFLAGSAAAHAAFVPYPGRPGKWLCDLGRLARQRLAALGVEAVTGGDRCTVDDARLFSHRRDRGRSGRMAAVIWRARGAG
ncbi:MAG: peptidoglycan editing factor PgeF [Burkholderiales bacterium]|nr:peptidoglycan editing factor PgeF [Burkholderiales bacterium]